MGNNGRASATRCIAVRLFQALPLVVLLASSTALADFPSGEAAYKGKDYGSAFSLLKPEAEASNAQAQYYLGVMLRRGDGVQKDANAAADWFLKAAEQGHPEAQSTIAALYRLGEGLPQDYSKAMHWYLEAARQGFENAQYRIALMYRAGQGGPENIAEAYKWAYMSAMQSQPEPMRLRDKLAKQLSAAQIQSAHQEAATFLAEVPARKAEAKKRLEASLSPTPQPAASPQSPSNNSCSQAPNPIDALKCLDPELVKLDAEVAQLYRDGLTRDCRAIGGAVAIRV
jgi:TPR repeat protein